MAYEEEKTYIIEGRTLDEIKEKLFAKYGSDYRIVGKRTDFRPGFLGFKQKEVQIVKYKINHSSFESTETSSTAANYGIKTVSEAEAMEKNRQALLEVLAKQAPAQNTNNDALAKMTKQIEELTSKISTMQNSMNVSEAASENHPTIAKIEEILADNEFSYAYIKMIISKIRAQFPLEQLDDYNLVQRYVVDWIGETIEIAKEKTFRPPHVIIIVGPTGVGKTTTIAKLASTALLTASEENRIKPEICIVTTDTMRVGAMEQLSKFGEILDKPVLKAETVDDVKHIYDEYKNHVDYIYIDTSGYSPNDVANIGKMKAMLDVNMNSDIYLSFAASTKASDILNIFRNYEPFDYDSVIVTKFDETKRIGNIISVLWEKHKSISYITDGQKVPRNIRKANVVDILINLNGFDIDRIHIEDVFGEK